ncbi:AAA family ATPase [Terrabacter sp. NPDC000476]|uniref:AAA family ATPase n=1 Tax=Terrabacter sp. NPDC000476 TaxID=3154258 RepID=UPI00332C85B4
MSAAPSPRLYSLAELLHDGLPPFRVSGLVHRDLTGIAGPPYTGKSTLVAGLAAGLSGGCFLGRPWERPPDRILFVCTDMGSHRQMARLVASMGLSPDSPDVTIAAEAPADKAGWVDLRRRAGLTSDSLVVIDNLSAIVGDFNDSGACKTFFDALRQAFVSEDISTVVVMHMSEKAPNYGPQRLQPLGSTVISAALRHVLYVVPKGEGMAEITTRGNDLEEPLVLSVRTVRGEDGPAGFEVLTEQAVGDRKRQRDRDTLDQNALRSSWVVANCQGMNKQQTADALAAEFGGKASGHAKQLQPSRPLGMMLAHQPDGNRWTLRGA